MWYVWMAAYLAGIGAYIGIELKQGDKDVKLGAAPFLWPLILPAFIGYLIVTTIKNK